MMDIWMVGCISFVFGALAEFIVVKYLAWKKALETKAAEDRKAEMEAYWAKISPRQGNEGQNETKRRLNVNNKDNPYLQFYNDLNTKEMMMMRDKVVEKIQLPVLESLIVDFSLIITEESCLLYNRKCHTR
jgi:hypothetical protein